MGYTNVGVLIDGRHAASKAAVRRALADDPSRVRLYGTSPFNPGVWTVDELEVGENYSAVGPDPERDRRWYSTITRSADGKVKVA